MECNISLPAPLNDDGYNGSDSSNDSKLDSRIEYGKRGSRKWGSRNSAGNDAATRQKGKDAGDIDPGVQDRKIEPKTMGEKIGGLKWDRV
ncbi:hypothetical protein GX48_02561 [Paracoccidioides brasiliensis]|nr:hypothetical protein GX48_02561 [Paracoccidioides brasiliensis]